MKTQGAAAEEKPSRAFPDYVIALRHDYKVRYPWRLNLWQRICLRLAGWKVARR